MTTTRATEWLSFRVPPGQQGSNGIDTAHTGEAATNGAIEIHAAHDAASPSGRSHETIGRTGFRPGGGVWRQDVARRARGHG